MKEARRKVMGEEGKIGAWYFGVGSYPLVKAGIPLVGFGPANEHFAHTLDDHVPVEHLGKAAKVYLQLIKDLCC
jgi:acetylornithine deacetylase/succinyl-diaminopimelate desuccinylase-like protein